MLYLIIDCHAAAYRAFFSTGMLRHGDRATGIPYGFMLSMLQLGEEHQSNRFLFCWDSMASKRKQLFHEYKVSRSTMKKTPEEIAERKKIHDQIDALRDGIIPAFGFKNMFRQEGYEADDLIAALPAQYPDKKFVAVSGDHDLFQLLRYKNFHLHIPSFPSNRFHQSKKPVLWTASRFMTEHGIPAREWAMVKCISGCKSDCVPGVPGVGESTAIKFLKGELKEGSSKFMAISNASKVIARNRPLVCLPFAGVKPLTIVKDRVSFERNLKPVFCDLGFASFLKGTLRARWERLAELGEKEKEGPF